MVKFYVKKYLFLYKREKNFHLSHSFPPRGNWHWMFCEETSLEFEGISFNRHFSSWMMRTMSHISIRILYSLHEILSTTFCTFCQELKKITMAVPSPHFEYIVRTNYGRTLNINELYLMPQLITGENHNSEIPPDNRFLSS